MSGVELVTGGFGKNPSLAQPDRRHSRARPRRTGAARLLLLCWGVLVLGLLGGGALLVALGPPRMRTARLQPARTQPAHAITRSHGPQPPTASVALAATAAHTPAPAPAPKPAPWRDLLKTAAATPAASSAPPRPAPSAAPTQNHPTAVPPATAAQPRGNLPASGLPTAISPPLPRPPHDWQAFIADDLGDELGLDEVGGPSWPPASAATAQPDTSDADSFVKAWAPILLTPLDLAAPPAIDTAPPAAANLRNAARLPAMRQKLEVHVAAGANPTERSRILSRLFQVAQSVDPADSLDGAPAPSVAVVAYSDPADRAAARRIAAAMAALGYSWRLERRAAPAPMPSGRTIELWVPSRRAIRRPAAPRHAPPPDPSAAASTQPQTTANAPQPDPGKCDPTAAETAQDGTCDPAPKQIHL